jgi:hypothetical protein
MDAFTAIFNSVVSKAAADQAAPVNEELNRSNSYGTFGCVIA